MGLDNLDQNYYSKTFPGTNHPWSDTQTKQDYIKQRQNTLLNFSEDFNKSEILLNPIVLHAITVLQQGEDVYKVLEMVMTRLAKENKEQFDLMKQLVENCGQPLLISKNI